MKKLLYLISVLTLFASCSDEDSQLIPEEGNFPKLQLKKMAIYEKGENDAMKIEQWKYNDQSKIAQHLLKIPSEDYEISLAQITYGEKEVRVDSRWSPTTIFTLDEQHRTVQIWNEDDEAITHKFSYDDQRLIAFTCAVSESLPGGLLQDYEVVWEDGDMVELVSEWEGSLPDACRTRFVFEFEKSLNNRYNVDVCMLLASSIIPQVNALGLQYMFAVRSYGQVNKHMLKSVRYIRESRNGYAQYAESYIFNYMDVVDGVVNKVGISRSKVSVKSVDSGLYDQDVRVVINYK